MGSFGSGHEVREWLQLWKGTLFFTLAQCITSYFMQKKKKKKKRKKMFNAILCSQFSPCLPAGHSSQHVPFMRHPLPLQLPGHEILQSTPYRPGGHTVSKQGMISVWKSCIRISVPQGVSKHLLELHRPTVIQTSLLYYSNFKTFNKDRIGYETINIVIQLPGYYMRNNNVD